MAIDRTVFNTWPDDDGSNTVGELISRSDIINGLLDPIDAAIALKASLAPRVTTTTSSATPTPNADTTDLYSLTAQAAAAAFGTPTGTPANGQALVIRIKDNATARALTWSSGYVAGGVTLPSTTVLSKILTINLRYNTDNALNKWQCLWVAQEDAVAGSGGVATSAPTTTGTQTALALPTGTGDLVIYATNATLLTVQGIAAGLPGQRLTIVSKGAGQIDFAHAHASGTALGKLALFATVGLTSLAAGSGVAVFRYDATATVWRLEQHQQGAWITRAFAAGNFVGTGAMTWTVAACTTDAYTLNGRTLVYSFDISGTIGGTPNAMVSILIPGGLVAAKTQLFTCIVSNGGANAAGYCYVLAGTSQVVVSFSPSGAGARTAGAAIDFATVTIEVQ